MKKIKTTKQKNAGITLIALVITIVVLLILAGIIINLTLGEDGIIKRAQEAGKNYVDAAEYEKWQLGQFTNEMDNVIKNVSNNGRIQYNCNVTPEVVLKGYTFIDKYGNIQEGTLTSITTLADLPWTKHDTTSFTATTDCYVTAGVGSGAYTLYSSGISCSAKISTDGTQIFYNGDASSNAQSGGVSCATSGLYKLKAGDTFSISSNGINVGGGGHIYYANINDISLQLNKLENLTWQQGSKSFTAPGHCYVIAYISQGYYNVNSVSCSSSISTTGTKTISYSGGKSTSPAVGGNFVSSMGIYELSEGQSVTCSSSGSNVPAAYSLYYALLEE